MDGRAKPGHDGAFVTADLSLEHREGRGGAFTRRYGLRRLVCYEHHDDIQRKHAMKHNNRA